MGVILGSLKSLATVVSALAVPFTLGALVGVICEAATRTTHRLTDWSLHVLFAAISYMVGTQLMGPTPAQHLPVRERQRRTYIAYVLALSFSLVLVLIWLSTANGNAFHFSAQPPFTAAWSGPVFGFLIALFMARPHNENSSTHPLNDPILAGVKPRSYQEMLHEATSKSEGPTVATETAELSRRRLTAGRLETLVPTLVAIMLLCLVFLPGHTQERTMSKQERAALLDGYPKGSLETNLFFVFEDRERNIYSTLTLSRPDNSAQGRFKLIRREGDSSWSVSGNMMWSPDDLVLTGTSAEATSPNTDHQKAMLEEINRIYVGRKITVVRLGNTMSFAQDAGKGEIFEPSHPIEHNPQKDN